MNPATDTIRTGDTPLETLHTNRPAWMQAKERGSDFWLRVMTWLSLLVGRACTRPIVYGIALYFTLFARNARYASRDYLQRCLGRPPRWRDLYRHILVFSSTIHDRIFLLNNCFDRFELQAFGTDSLHADYNAGKGILLLGAHLGSFEVLRALGRTSPNFRMHMAMYPENARRINRALSAINPQASQEIIALGTLEAMLAISGKLDEGAYVGILADRAIESAGAAGATASKPTGPSDHRELPFLGMPARFPVGPFRLATLMKRPVYFMTGVYRGGNRYEIHFEKLEDFHTPTSCRRDAQIDLLMKKYVSALERNCRAHPFNWFNFYDFWHAN